MTDREKQAIYALYDFSTRSGATTKKVLKQMKDAGFTKKETNKAAEAMS